MTGYGKKSVLHNGKKITAEVRALNSKSLDLFTKTAPQYKAREIALRQLIAKELLRGKVDFSLTVEEETVGQGQSLCLKTLKNYKEQIDMACQELGVERPKDYIALMLHMPEVMAHKEAEEVSDEEWQAAQEAALGALEQCTQFRRQEGAALERKFREKIANIAALLEQIEPYEKERVEKIRCRITDSLKAIPEASYDENRLEQELIYYIEKLDISEEKQRLKNHLKYFLDTMEESDSTGKKLGFIAQEMGREINTTGSKSNLAEMQNIVVKMKDELEQIKEQVLNAL